MKKTNVMVTDDLKNIRESLKLILEDDFNVQEAESGYEALEIVKKGETLIVLLDVLMPGMDGLETLREIKDLNSNVEVCMITAVCDKAKIQEATKLGAFDYIIKPFDVERVRQSIINIEKKIISRKQNPGGHHPHRN